MGRKPRDLSGQRFGRLIVKGRLTSEYDRHGVKWQCTCDCGGTATPYGHHLTQGKIVSCGCRKSEHAKTLDRTTHGMYGTPEYASWQAMKTRCGNSNHVAFDRYGGRGIQVCERWEIFENFFSDMGRKPGPEYSIERRNNDLGYSPDNCRWATPMEQQRNTGRAKLFECDGRLVTQRELSRELGIHNRTLGRRLAKDDTLNGLVRKL